MQEWFQAFLLGNSAILTNVCLLPLYPGLIAFLAGQVGAEKRKAPAPLLGLFVLAGVLSLMILVGFLLYILNRSFADLLSWLLPLIYVVVFALGLAMLLGFNPFYRLANRQSPIFNNPYLSAFSYGLMLGPMTLPCTGPIILSAFLVGAGSFNQLADGLSYFLFFGLGFGWPLVVLPLIALPLQRRSLGWLSQNHKLLSRISGLLLIAIAIFGFWTEILPQWR
ncbi:MAG: cytochrome c biogenesis protein CcdA [Deinococcales bacterium]